MSRNAATGRSRGARARRKVIAMAVRLHESERCSGSRGWARVSEDEVFILLAGLVFAAWGAISWYLQISVKSLAPYPGLWRVWLALAPVAGLALIFAVLKTGASFDVRESALYLSFYMVLGAAWVFWAVRLNIVFGVSLRDDAIERRNPAAAAIVISAMLAQAAIYAGGNVGDGPGWWIVAVAALLAGAVWAALWWVVEVVLGVSERVTVERDLAMAVRLGGYMVASGMLCGRGVAGDWVSLANMLAEFGDAWALAPLTLAAVGVEMALRGAAVRRSVGVAVLVGAAYVAAAAFTIASAPPLASNPDFPDTPPPAVTQGAT